MTLLDLIKQCNTAYEKRWPECPLTDFVGGDGRPLDPMPSGDTLAAFIVRELNDVYDPEASPEENTDNARKALARAVIDLQAVIGALKYG